MGLCGWVWVCEYMCVCMCACVCIHVGVCACVCVCGVCVCNHQLCVSFSQHAVTSSKPLSAVKKAPSSQLKQLLEQHNLTIEDISKEVSDDHINEIYSQMENWEQVANHLSLTRPDIRAIESRAGRYDVEKRMYTLQDWKNKNKVNKEATYQVLLEALLKSSSNNSAIKVFELLANA